MITPLTHPPTVDSTKPVRFKRGRSQEFRQNIRVLVFRNYKLNVNLLRTEETSNEMETHVNVFAPSRTKRFSAKRFGPLIILKKTDTRSA